MTERRPWRYRCPTCRSVQVTRYSGARMPSRNELVGRKLHHSGNLRTGIMAIPKYHCENCHGKFDTPKDMLISGSKPDSGEIPAEMIHSRTKHGETNFEIPPITPPNFSMHSNDSEKISRVAGALVQLRAATNHGLRTNHVRAGRFVFLSCPFSDSTKVPTLLISSLEEPKRRCESGGWAFFSSSHLSSARSERHVISANAAGSNPAGGFRVYENLRRIET